MISRQGDDSGEFGKVLRRRWPRRNESAHPAFNNFHGQLHISSRIRSRSADGAWSQGVAVLTTRYRRPRHRARNRLNPGRLRATANTKSARKVKGAISAIQPEKRAASRVSFATPATGCSSVAAGMSASLLATLLPGHCIYFSSFGVAAITTGSKLSTLLEPPNCNSISEREPSGLMR
jgi:hypothetical protein